MQAEYVGDRPISLPPEAVPAVVLVKNEMKMLPHFLRHHRELGVGPFFFIDNGSTDGSFEYLQTQKDCFLFQALGSFREASYGMDWVNSILQAYCRGHWALYLDCDESLVYPACETIGIASYCSSLASKGYDCIYGAMIDMYPEGSFLDTSIGRSDNLLDQLNYFDADYVFREWPRRPWDTAPEKFPIQIIGGPRLRLLSNLKDESRRGFVYYTLCNQIDRFIDHVPLSWIGFLARHWPMELPAQQKSPLNFISDDFKFSNSHSNSNHKLANETVALLHFKLCDELRQRLEQPAILMNHYRRGLSYEQLRQAAERWRGKSLVYKGSRKFTKSDDLLALGLIGENVARLWKEPKSAVVQTA